MAIPDFGEHVVDFESGGYSTKIACKYMAPGLTFQDLTKLFNEAEAQAAPHDSLSANPAEWPTHRGIMAVVDAVLKAVYDQTPPPNNR